MKFLIVEDDDSKIYKIQQVIESSGAGEDAILFVKKTVSEAVSCLLEEPHIDLMILDLNLPMRKGEDIKPLSGLKIISELTKRSTMTKPKHIIGLTAQIPPPVDANKFFVEEGWVLVGYDPTKTSWETTILNKIIYAGEAEGAVIKGKKKSILYLSAVPSDGEILLLGREERRISDTLKMSKYRDEYGFESRQGCTIQTMTSGVMAEKPAILHFSGHGNENGIALEDEEGNMHFISTEILLLLIEGFAEGLECIILSSCYSAEQAALLSVNDVYVIGMQDSVSVGLCEEFAVGFYQALGEKNNIEKCFLMGSLMARAKFDYNVDIPQLWYNGTLLK